ncbi:helix-turn-helix domain-containing protein [Dechloromonas denitrificans]|uniref:helix-turn-helix transcriptional regulator n=1 Tax=Dechloromonas denitrificans TaxID=281362 RepID=UPI0009FAF01E
MLGMDTLQPQKLVTKEAAAELLSVSKRTIDNWIADGTLPPPTSIGRRVYWHPEAFRSWQDNLFGVKQSRQTENTLPRRGRPRAFLAN